MENLSHPKVGSRNLNTGRHSPNLTSRARKQLGYWVGKYAHLPSVDSQVVKENPLEEASPLFLLLQLLLLILIFTGFTFSLPDGFDDCINGVNLESRLNSIPTQTSSYHSKIIKGGDAKADLDEKSHCQGVNIHKNRMQWATLDNISAHLCPFVGKLGNKEFAKE